jgi:uncharacterized LabA/DUF88 family protein
LQYHLQHPTLWLFFYYRIMAQFRDQRVGVFVDISNMYYSARVISGRKVNFKKVLEVAVGERQLIRALAYGISTSEGQEEKFFEAMETSGYEMRTKDIQNFADGSKKGDWDIGIAIDIIKMAPKLDVVVLASGDGDYVPLVEYVQNTYGCRVEVIAFGESTSSKLVEAADQFTDISKKREFLLR